MGATSLILPPSVRRVRGLVLGADGPRLQPVPSRRLGPAPVRVRVRAVGLSALDLRRKTGTCPGAELAGEVMVTGAGFTSGERVFALLDPLRGGACADEVVVAAEDLVRMPARLSFEEAAAVPLGAVAAHFALEAEQLVPGERVLVWGAAGGVGSFAVQLAAAARCEVTAVCAPRDEGFVRRLGADRVTFAPRGPFDLVVDASGALGHPEARALLAEHGVHASLDTSPLAALRSAVAQVIPGPRYRAVRVRPCAAALARVAEAMAEGRVVSTVTRVYGVEHAEEALRSLASGQARGKLVLRL